MASFERLSNTIITSKSAKETITVLSFNLLAQCWANFTKRFPLDDKYLAWEYRKPQLQKEILQSDPDIVCLQEVDIDLFDDFASVFLSMGYNKIIKTKFKREIRNGYERWTNAVLYKTRFSQEWVDFRSRTMLLKLRDTVTNTPLFICNVHLEGHPSKQKQRFDQIKSSLKHMRKQILKMKGAPAPIIVCGDFNEGIHRPVGEYLIKQSLTYNFFDTSKQAMVGEKTFQHEFKFKEVYKGYTTDPTYIKNGNSFRVDAMYYTYDTLYPIAIKRILPEDKELRDKMLKGLPIKEHSSDHLPIACIFTIA